MLDSHLEGRLLIVRLKISAGDAGLRDDEVEAMLGLEAGGWPSLRIAATFEGLPRDQERRIRLLVELLGFLGRRLNDDEMVGEWMRAPRRALEDATALDLIARDPEALRAMVLAARRADDR